MDILFLGTSAALPSRRRSTSCIALKEGQDIVLLDCGEGSQRQMMVSPFSYMKVRAILITHLHGDHVFGLPGLLQTMGLSDRREPLALYGPPGIRDYVRSAMSYTEGEVSYPLDVTELRGGETFQIGRLTASCFRTEHGMASLGYVVSGQGRPGRLDYKRAIEMGIRKGPDMARLKSGEVVDGVRPEDVVGPDIPGITVVYSGDTRPCEATARAARGADVLIHEATYMDSEARNAREHNHATAGQAAQVAKAAGVKHLIMTHISHRYEDRSLLEAEARAVFPESYVAEDMELFEVTPSRMRMRDVEPERVASPSRSPFS